MNNIRLIQAFKRLQNVIRRLAQKNVGQERANYTPLLLLLDAAAAAAAAAAGLKMVPIKSPARGNFPQGPIATYLKKTL